MLQNIQNLMQSKAACCGTRIGLPTFRSNTLSPFSDMREESFYFFVCFLCRLFVCLFVCFFVSLFVCLFVSFFLILINEI